MNYPGRTIKVGESDLGIVSAVRRRLCALHHDISPEGVFDTEMEAHVKLFQIRNVDMFGRNLVPDGKIGPLTWGSLFVVEPIATRQAPNSLLKATIAIAKTQAGVREHPRNSNKGVDVEKYLRSVQCDPGNAWCAAFVFWCLQQASEQIGAANPCARTGSVMQQWNHAVSKKIARVSAKAAMENPGLIEPGMIFVIDYRNGLGHTGIVTGVSGPMLDTIEGNTDASKTREGGGVYALKRKVGEINKGYISYA